MSDFNMTAAVYDAITDDRAHQSLHVAGTWSSGKTIWKDGRVVHIEAPMMDGAYARTVRNHEAIHANRDNPPQTSEQHLNQDAVTAVDDILVHTALWPDDMPEQANRDCLYTGIVEATKGVPFSMATENWNQAITSALRGMAITRKLRHISDHVNTVDAKLGDTFTESGVDGNIMRDLRAIVDLTTKGKRHKAIKRLSKLMVEDDINLPMKWALMPSDDDLFTKLMHNKGEYVLGSVGPELRQNMRIVKLPMVEPTNAQQPTTVTQVARSGPRLNRPMLARVIANRSPSCAFKKTRYIRRAGGSVLLDSSGSMHLTNKQLKNLCRQFPAATVAYYFGWSRTLINHYGCYGDLVIYAENGRRAQDVGQRDDNNSVDLYAIQWLLKQPAPRYIVTDRDFCGGPTGQNIAASQLLDEAIKGGLVTCCQDGGHLRQAMAS
jgi:hypothetical protein